MSLDAEPPHLKTVTYILKGGVAEKGKGNAFTLQCVTLVHIYIYKKIAFHSVNVFKFVRRLRATFFGLF